jgi:tetratricopeptide (TPR) repeat protein
LLLGALGACSSTTSSVREIVDQAEQPIEADSPEVVETTADTPAESTVDLSIEPNLEEISERTQRRYDEALAAMRSENWTQAELELEQLIADEPGFPGPYVNLALIYDRDGRSDEARQALEQALVIAPEFPPANNELGRLLREQGAFAAAEAAYGRALAGDPGNAIAHLNLGILLDVYLRRPADALEHYNQYQASRTEPDETVARWIVDLERRARAAERVALD